jgi:hypothetical protein
VKEIIRKFFKEILLKKYFGIRTINRKNIIIYKDSNLMEIEIKNSIKNTTCSRCLFFSTVKSLDKYINAKHALAPAAKILAPVYVGESENQLINVMLLRDHKINEITLF